MPDIDPAEIPVGTCRYHHEGTAVAIKTDLPREDMAWGIMTISTGGRYTKWEEVADWLESSPVNQPAPPAKAAPKRPAKK